MVLTQSISKHDALPAAPRAHTPRDAQDATRRLMLAESVGELGHWQWDLASNDITWSSRMFSIHGLVPSQAPLPWASAIEMFHVDDRAFVMAQLRNAVAERSSFEFDSRILRSDGVCRTVICKGEPEFSVSGSVVALFGMLADVTEAFDAIHSMQDQKEMLDLAAHLAHLGHWVWTRADDRISFCSEELALIHDLSAHVFMTRFPHPDLLAAEVVAADRARYRSAVKSGIGRGQPYTIEYRIETAAGAVKDIREIGQPILSETGELKRFIATAQDVTETKRRENELARAKDELKRKTAELEDANLQKDKLFSIIAHDLRSPFNPVMGFSELLAMKADALPRDKIASYARIVHEAAGDVKNLLDNLLAWASFQLREGGFKPSPLDLSVVVKAGIEPLIHMAEEKGIALENDIAPTPVIGDEDLICVVIRNLISNAIKFSRNGGKIRISAEPVAAAAPPLVRVSVHDDGIGMSPETVNTLFELSRTASTSGTRGEKGTGLGLYLCRDIVARHGGHLSIQSVAGSGTAIQFTLPARV